MTQVQAVLRTEVRTHPWLHGCIELSLLGETDTASDVSDAKDVRG